MTIRSDSLRLSVDGVVRTLRRIHLPQGTGKHAPTARRIEAVVRQGRKEGSGR